MTVSDLKALLDDLVETYGEEWADETKCRIAYQPSYPLACDLAGVTAACPGLAAEFDEDAEGAEEAVAEAKEAGKDPERPEALVLCSGENHGYGERWWWDAYEG